MKELENKEETLMEEEKKDSSVLIKLLKFLFIVGLIMLLYVRFIGTSGLQIKEYSIVDENIPAGFDGLKIVQLSDIHYGTTVNKNKLEKIVDKVNMLKPDIVIFTGDLYDNSILVNDKIVDEISSTLNKIEANIGKYAVIGNHDYSNDIYEDIITKSGFTYLKNASKIIYNDNNEPIEIVGYDDAWMGKPDYNIELTSNYKIALIHEPDEIDNIKDKEFNLVFAGHSHGGQVRLPILGSLFTPQGAKKYTNDYYEVGNTKMYVSYGIGTSMLKVRYFDRPSINLYRLYKN